MNDARKRRGAGLKINNDRSSIATPPAQSAQEALDAKAGKVMEKIDEFKIRTLELATKYKTLFDSKVLAPNKTQLIKDAEREIITNLVKLALEMEADDFQPIGQGSTSLLSLTMNIMLMMRDRMNELEFRIERAEKELAKTNANNG
jgi:hypothetical protein